MHCGGMPAAVQKKGTHTVVKFQTGLSTLCLEKKRLSLYCRYLTFLSNEQLVSFCPVGNVLYFSVLIPHALGTGDFVFVVLCAVYVNSPHKFY